MARKTTHIKKKKVLYPLLTVVLAAAVVRCIYLCDTADNPTFFAPIVDSRTYHDLATLLASGKGMRPDFFWQQFFYPFFLSCAYYISNSSILFAKIIQLLLGCATCGLTCLLGKRLFDCRTGIIAGLLTAAYGPLIFYEAELLATGWAAFWSVALLLLFLETVRLKKAWLFFILGICGGLSVLTRPNFLFFLVAGCVWLGIVLYQASRDVRKLIPLYVYITLGFVLVVTPVAMKNYQVNRDFTFLPATGGLNFWKGNNPDSRETVALRPGPEWERFMDLPRSEGIRGDRAENAFFYRKTVKYMISQPLHFLGGIVRKTTQFVNGRETPGNIDIYLYRKWSWVLSGLVWKAGKFGFPFGVLFTLAVIGLVFHRQRGSGIVALFLAIYSLSVIAFFLESRYRIPIIPALSLFAASGCIAIIEMIRSKRLILYVQVSVVAAGAILLSTLPGAFYQETQDCEAELCCGVGQYYSSRNDLAAATEWYEKSIALDPEYETAYCNLGVIKGKQNKLDEAIALFNKAGQINPAYSEVQHNLGNAYEKKGDRVTAFGHYIKAADLDIDHYKARTNAGSILLQNGQYNEALLLFQEALRIEPNYPNARLGLKIALEQKRKMESN